MRDFKSESGFSLVEMMVVVVIIGLMTSAVALTFPAGSSFLQKKAERTEKAMTALSRRSVMTGQILGARFSQSGFDILRLSEEGWAIEDTILKSEIQTWVTVRPVKLAVNNTDIDFSDEVANPHIWFLPTGEHPSFTLILSASGKRATISSLPSGVIRVSGDG